MKILRYYFLIIFSLVSFAAYAQNSEDNQMNPASVVEEQPAALTEKENIAQPVVSSTLDALELRDMDINDVLKLLSSKSGLNIIAGKAISGRVTIFLQNVDVHDALTIILKSNDLAYVEDRGIVQVITATEYEQMFGHKFGTVTTHEIFPLQSAKAADIVVLLNQVKSASGKVIADDQTNSLIIEEVPERLKILLDYIKELDAPTDLKVYKLKYISAEALTTKLQEMVSPKIGSAKFDLSSNKIFVKDTAKKIAAIDAFITQVDIPRETKVFEISYAKAEDIAKTVTTLLTKDIGSAQFDSRTNSLIVTDIAPKMIEIKNVILSIDRQQKQVLIEARIVQIDLSDQYSMGINWNTIFPNERGLTLTNESLTGFSTVKNLSLASIGTFNDDGYKIALDMIASLGNTHTLSNPRIAVVNNQEAKILVGSQQAYINSTITTPASGPQSESNQVNFIDVGTKLTITPTIHDDGYITMKIKPEVSSAEEGQVTSNGKISTVPIKKSSEIETTIRVKDGVTIMIGGLIKDEDSNKKNKIPILGDIPLLGKAFRNENRRSIKSETVVFLTPRIITGDVQVDESSMRATGIKASKTYYNPFPKDEDTTPITP